MVSFPYPKSLTANPFVNQGAALLVTDADTARAARHPRGSLGAPDRRRRRRRARRPAGRVAYHRVPALDVTVRPRAGTSPAPTADDYDVVELYSCFPAMPKLAATCARAA